MKELLKSKTFYTGAAAIIGGIALIITGDRDSGLQLIATGLAAVFLRDGINKASK